MLHRAPGPALAVAIARMPSLALTLALVLSATAHSAAQTSVEQYHARVPLGVIGFLVHPASRTLYIMSTANSPLFEGWRVVEHSPVSAFTILDRSGSRVRYYPHQLHFRVTATTMLDLIDVDRDPLEIKGDLNDFLLRLGFRLKIFHGLEVKTLTPDSIDMLGVPSDVKAEERVYRANFILPARVPVEDRVALEILTPTGDRLCKFNLDF
jgi:hypothetical protein